MAYILLLVALVATDQITKFIVLSKLKGMGTYPVIQDVFHFTYAENTGTAFSMFKDEKFLVMIITSLALIAIFFYLLKTIKNGSESQVYIISLVMILSGGMGNLIDRFRLGYVVDFIDVRAINFAIFNVADVFIVTAVLLILLSFIKEAKS